MSVERIWQVRLPDGSVWIPEDSRPGDPRASWMYARSTADMFARDLGGQVVEVTPRQKEKLLDKEIAAALTGRTKARPRRPLGRTARRAIAAEISGYLELPGALRSALEIARETADTAEYAGVLKRLAAALPASLWVGYEADRDRALVNSAEPIWIDENPEEGEDPAVWRQIDRDEITRMLVEDA